MLMLCVCYAFLSVPCSLVITCLARANLLALLYVTFSCVLSLSNVVPWVRCGTCLYQFLIFAVLLTFIKQPVTFFKSRERQGKHLRIFLT